MGGKEDFTQNNEKPKISKHIFGDNIFLKNKAKKLYEVT